MKISKKARRDAALVAVLLLLAAALFAISRLARAPGAAVEVRVGGEVCGTFSLGENAVIDVAGHCTLTIEDGAARVSAADCKNHICTAHPPISRAGEMIVCLPNGVSVRVLGDEFDFVT